MDLYIYYRVARAQAPQLQTQVNAMQALLRREHKISAALKRRPRPDNGPDVADPVQAPDTWMEVYLAVPDDFENTVDRAFDAAGYTALIDGTRHIEYFVDCTPCV
jgi:hypothetical protein